MFTGFNKNFKKYLLAWGHYAKWKKSKGKKYCMISLISEILKMKLAHWYREKIDSFLFSFKNLWCLSEVGEVRGGQKGWRGSKSTNLQLLSHGDINVQHGDCS